MHGLISVILPVYNNEHFLPRSIDSVLEQSYSNIEVILVDDGSTDNSGKICNEYTKKDKRIKVIHKKNGGLSDARNIGMKQASGEYIMFVDADDWMPKDAVEKLYDAIVKNGADLSSGIIKEVFSRKKVAYEYSPSKSTVYDCVGALRKLMYLHDGASNSASGKLYKMNLFKNVKYPVGKLYEDLGTTYKIFAKAKKIVLVDKIVYYYYQNSNSIMHAKYTTKRLQGITFAEEELKFMKKNFPDAKNAALYRLFYEHLLCLNDMPLSCIDKNDSIKFIKRYRKNILDDRSLYTKQRLLCMASYLGHPGIKLAFFFKNKLKSMR